MLIFRIHTVLYTQSTAVSVYLGVLGPGPGYSALINVISYTCDMYISTYADCFNFIYQGF